MEANHAIMRRAYTSGLRRVLVSNFLAVLGITFLISLSLVVLATILANVYASQISHLGRVIESIGTLIIFPLLPSIFLIMAAVVFTRRIMQQLNEPIQELMQAVNKIRQRDLDFEIHYDKANELGDLCRAFHELQHELRESLEREWRRQEEMQEALALLSHDLRTPVAIIQGHIENLIQTPETRRTERLQTYLPTLEACSQRMSHLVHDILLATTLEQTEFIPHTQQVLLNQELTRKAEAYTLQAQEKGLSFAYTTRSEIGTQTLFALDMHYLEQIVDNLFANALRFTPSPGQITLSYIWNEQELRIIMCDTGSGIDPADLPHIFNKFYQGKHTQKHRDTSAGLGLYICKMLVEKLGGTITARNVPTGGCEMMVVLPVTYQEQHV